MVRLAAVGAIWLVIASNAFAYSGGTGEANDPYQIATREDLLALGANTGDYGKCFMLTADVNMAGQAFTTAIIAPDISANYGFQGISFTGTFDGNEYKILNFTINGGDNDYLGLFGQISSGGFVKNLDLERLSVSGLANSYEIGGLVGYNFGKIEQCSVTGVVSGIKYDIGGFAGYNSGILTNCYAACTVSGNYKVGGLVGYNDNKSTITNCYSTGSVIGINSYSATIGGLVGLNVDGAITNCYSTASVSGQSEVGGLVGNNWSKDGTITSCYATGAVTDTDDGYSYNGGLVGINDGIITNCYTTNSVSGSVYVGGLVGRNNGGTLKNCYRINSVSGSNNVGGLVGINNTGSTITNCFSAVSVNGSNYVGGLAGCNFYAKIISCYSTGAVGGLSFVGGMVGENTRGKVIRCYSTGEPTGTSNVGGLCGIKDTGSGYEDTGNFWDTETSRTMTSVMGTGLSTLQMKQQTSFTGWDFTNEIDNGTNDYWRMCADGMDYPRLTWEFVKVGDFSCPNGINMNDLLRLSEDWLTNYSQGLYGADSNADGTVTIADFAVMASNWLKN